MKGGPPSTWSTAEIGDVVAVSRLRTDPQDHPDMPFIGMDSVEAHTMRLLDTVPARTMKSSAIHFFPGDVLYGRLRPYLNKVLAPGFEGLASAEFIPLTPEPGIFHEFIRYRLNATDFVSFTSHLDEGDRPRVDWDGIRRFKFLLPPGAEQRRIVEAIESHLTRLDDAISSLEGVQAKLKGYRASVLKAAVEGRLVPTEASLARAEKRDYEPADRLLARILEDRRRCWEEVELSKLKAAGKPPKDDRWKAKYPEPVAPDTDTLPELPEGWCWASVDQLGLVSGGLTQNAKREKLKTKLPFLRVANVYANALVLDEIKMIGVEPGEIERVRLSTGDLLVVEGNGSVDQIGRVALWDGSIEQILHQNHLIKVRCEPRQLSKWVLAWLLSPAGRAAIVRVASSTSGLHTLSISKVGRLVVPLPPLTEQTRAFDEVDAKLSLSDAVGETVLRDLHRCSRLRQAVLRWAFEGKLVDQDQTDEPADDLLARIHAERAAVGPTQRNISRRQEEQRDRPE